MSFLRHDSPWIRHAVAAIEEAIKGLPPEQWQAAIDAAYPFGERRYWPYRQWLKVRRSYLRQAKLLLGEEPGRVPARRGDTVAGQRALF